MTELNIHYDTWISNVFAEFKASNLSTNTMTAYASTLDSFLYFACGTAYGAHIVIPDVESSVANFLASLSSTHKPASIAAKKAALKFCFSAVGIGVAEKFKTPSEQYEASPQIPGGMSTIQRVFVTTMHSPSECFARQAGWVVAATGLTGMRISECLGITRESFSEAFESIRVEGKGRKYRTIPIPAFARPLIHGLQYTLDGFDRKRATRLFETAYRRAGVPDVTPHMARATYASHVYDKTQDIVAVAYLLGHANVQTTKRYITPAHVEAVRVAFDDMT